MQRSIASLATLAVLSLAVMLHSSPAQARATGDIEVISATVDAKVFIDGEYIGDLPLAGPITLPIGEHTIKITKAGHTDFIEVLQIDEGENEPLFVELFAVSGILIIETEQPGSIVSVDGEVLGKTPFKGEIQPGKRSIMVARKGYKDFVQLLDIEVGEEYQLDVKLEKLEGDAIGQVDVDESTPWYKTWWFWTATGVVLVGVTTFAVLAATEEEAATPVDFSFSL